MAIKFVSVLLLLNAATSTYADSFQGGVATSITAHPYYASIEGDDGVHICGGAVISDKFVITAAACLADYDVSQLVVRVGGDAPGKGTVMQIARSSFYGGYDFVTNENDIGLVKLAKPITESSSTRTVKVASSNAKSGTNGVVIGLDANNHLVEAPVTVINYKDCTSGKYGYSRGALFKSHVCGLSKSGKACDMPLGSPLVANNKLVGLVSWGYGCTNKGNAAIYANVAELKSWIADTLKNF